MGSRRPAGCLQRAIKFQQQAITEPRQTINIYDIAVHRVQSRKSPCCITTSLCLPITTSTDLQRAAARTVSRQSLTPAAIKYLHRVGDYQTMREFLETTRAAAATAAVQDDCDMTTRTLRAPVCGDDCTSISSSSSSSSSGGDRRPMTNQRRAHTHAHTPHP